MLSRRLLLQGLATVLSAQPAPAASKSHRKAPARLSGSELKSVVAYGEVLVEGRALEPVERDLLSRHIEEAAASNSEMLGLYRATSRLLDRLARTRFSALALDQRRVLVAQHGLATVSGDQSTLASATIVDIRTRVIPDLIEAYWSSPAGWAAIGYTTYPGRCGDLSRYTRPDV